MLILLQSFRIIELEWVCSSAGRAPALQVGRQSHKCRIWCRLRGTARCYEVGLKSAWLRSLGQRRRARWVVSHSRNVQALEPAKALQLTSERPI